MLRTAASRVTHCLQQAAFLARFLAFRQHMDTLLLYVPTKTAKTKTWRLSVQRRQICADVIRHFSSAGNYAKTKLWSPTAVTFISANTNLPEDGDDQGGLTVEMYTSFFREVVLPDFGLFEGVLDADGYSASIGLLPSPKVRPEICSNPR